MKLLIVMLLLLIVALQYRAWFSDEGYFAAQTLAKGLERQRDRAEMLRQRNRRLAREVMALKEGYAAVEARARSDLAMIRDGETFYIVDEEPLPGDTGALPGSASQPAWDEDR